MFRKILLPVHGNMGEAAIQYARQIASASRAELCLLHVVKESRHRSCRHSWPHEAYRCSISGLPPPSRLVLPGEPAEMIVAYADHIDADLILMPTRGYGLLGQLLFGSTTMDVIRRTTRAVWVAKKPLANIDGAFPCKRVICGIDVTSEGQAVLRDAVWAATTWGADLVIVHAIPGVSDAVLARYGLDETDDIGLLPKAAGRRIRSMCADLTFPFEVDVMVGDPADCLSRAVKKWGADLLIVGRGKRTNRWSLGANIGEVIARSPCPVITCRPHLPNTTSDGGHDATGYWAKRGSAASLIAAAETAEPEHAAKSSARLGAHLFRRSSMWKTH